MWAHRLAGEALLQAYMGPGVFISLTQTSVVSEHAYAQDRWPKHEVRPNHAGL